MQGDPDMDFLLSDIKAIDKMRSQHSVSLNIDERKLEREERREERLQRENDRRLAVGLDPVESLEDISEDAHRDVLLDQAAEILTDLAGLNDPNASMQTRATGS